MSKLKSSRRSRDSNSKEISNSKSLSMGINQILKEDTSQEIFDENDRKIDASRLLDEDLINLMIQTFFKNTMIDSFTKIESKTLNYEVITALMVFSAASNNITGLKLLNKYK